MSRFTFELDTVKRTYRIFDSVTGGVLLVEQTFSRNFDVGDDDTDRLVEFANDVQDMLQNGALGLELHGVNTFTMKDNDFPWLSGHLQLRRCTLNNPHLHNVTMIDFKADCVDQIDVSNSTLQDFTFYQVGNLHFSHCFMNDKYDFRKEITCSANEWHLNTNVTGTMW